MRGLVFACLFSCALSSIAEAAQRCNLDENYNVNQRPDPAGQPTDVSLGVTIVDVLSINDLEGTVAIDLLATIEWRDARLLGLKGCRIESRQIWNPGVQMLNTAQYESAAELAVSILDDGVVRGTVRRRGDISNRFRMEEFPFDSRVITLEFLPLDYNIEEVKLTVNEQRARRLTTFSVPDWSIGDLATVVEEVERPLRGGKVPLYRMTLPAQRDPSYYLYKVMLPLIMIVMMSWCVFWIDPEKLEPQIAMAGTSMLTLIAFQFTLNDLLPRVGYLTALDVFVLGSSVLVFLALIEAVITGYLSYHGHHKLAQKLDFASRIVFPASLGLLLVIGF